MHKPARKGAHNSLKPIGSSWWRLTPRGHSGAEPNRLLMDGVQQQVTQLPAEDFNCLETWKFVKNIEYSIGL